MFTCRRILTWNLLKEESHYIYCLLYLSLPASYCVLHGIIIMHPEHHFPLTYRVLLQPDGFIIDTERSDSCSRQYIIFFKSMHWGSIYRYTVICFIIGGFKRKTKCNLLSVERLKQFLCEITCKLFLSFSMSLLCNLVVVVKYQDGMLVFVLENSFSYRYGQIQVMG